MPVARRSMTRAAAGEQARNSSRAVAGVGGMRVGRDRG